MSRKRTELKKNYSCVWDLNLKSLWTHKKIHIVYMTLNRQLSAFKRSRWWNKGKKNKTRQTDASNFYICGNACINETQKEVLHTLALSELEVNNRDIQQVHFRLQKKKFKNIFIVCASSPKKNHKHVMNICFIYAEKKSTLMMIHARTVHFINTRCALNENKKNIYIQKQESLAFS